MNKPLFKAERDITDLLLIVDKILSIKEIIDMLHPKHREAELRAVIWTLAADGIIEFESTGVQIKRS